MDLALVIEPGLEKKTRGKDISVQRCKEMCNSERSQPTLFNMSSPD